MRRRWLIAGGCAALLVVAAIVTFSVRWPGGPLVLNGAGGVCGQVLEGMSGSTLGGPDVENVWALPVEVERAGFEDSEGLEVLEFIVGSRHLRIGAMGYPYSGSEPYWDDRRIVGASPISIESDEDLRLLFAVAPSGAAPGWATNEWIDYTSGGLHFRVTGEMHIGSSPRGVTCEIPE